MTPGDTDCWVNRGRNLGRTSVTLERFMQIDIGPEDNMPRRASIAIAKKKPTTRGLARVVWQNDVL